MLDEGLYAQSFEEWRKRTNGSREEWRRVCASLWAKIKVQPHYHAGRACREVKCELYPNG
jgi:hypothetical protein